MSQLTDYIEKYSRRVPRDSSDPTAVDVVFFKVTTHPSAKAESLRDLVLAHKGAWGKVAVFDGDEHGYIELGGWLGSQEHALRLIGMGTHFGLWSLLSPRTMMGALIDDETEILMAQNGLVSIQACKDK